MATPTYGFPTPESTDPPAGHTQITDLSEAVEEELERIDSVRSPDVFTSDDTWNNPDDGFKAVTVRVVGDGGGSGGCAATGSGENAEAGSGGGGEYAEKFIPAGSLGSSETVTVGQGGSAGSSGNNDGGNGSGSSFGSHVSAGGGSGGEGSVATSDNAAPDGGAGGSGGSGGDLHVTGGDGGSGRILDGSAVRANLSGSSVLSGSIEAADTDASAQTGRDYGGGAFGGRNGQSSSAIAGAQGGRGVVIVHYHY